MSLRFRPGRLEDLDATCALLVACVAAMRAQGIDQWDEVYPARATLEADLREGTALLAEEAPHLRAFGVLDTHQDPAYLQVPWTLEGRVAVVHRLMVDPAVQGRGIAAAWMERVERWASELGFEVLRLDAFSENPTAQRLYQRLGYRHAGNAPFRKGEFVCFEKRL